jgi:hypothetical protein
MTEWRITASYTFVSGGFEMSILPSKQLTILHISDLHLATRDLKGKSRCRKLLESLRSRLAPEEGGWKTLWESLSIRRALENVGLCVISGDLCRRSPEAGLYLALRKELDARFPCVEGRRRWIAVPGNHDRRLLGNFFVDKTNLFERGLGLEEGWNQAWWDPDHPCIVVPLDSNPREAAPLHAGLALARGVLGGECNRISVEFQRVKESITKHFSGVLSKMTARKAASYAMDLCAAFNTNEIGKLRYAAYPKVGTPPCECVPGNLINRTAEVLSCLYMARAVRCVVLHHHPIGVRGDENTGIIHQDAHLLLADSGAFLQSARENQISLVLHGHKHVPHRIAVHLPGYDVEEVAIVGAGSSTQRSKHASATANLITINEAGEVEVELHDPCTDDWSRAPSKVHLRDWSQIRKHLSLEADKCARISSEETHVDVSVLRYGDAIMTVQMRGLKVRQDPGQRPPDTVQIPISYVCPTQIGPVQVTCQIEKQDSQWQEVCFHSDQEPGYDPGEWHGFVQVKPTAPELATPLTLTTRFIAFTTFAMNPWQASFMYASKAIPCKEFWAWRCRIPARRQLFVALETTRKRAFAATFDRLYPTYARVDDRVDEKERDEIIIDRASSGQRIAFTVPTPVWGSKYGLGWEWGQRSSTRYPKAPVSTRLREQLEDEANKARSGATSLLRSRLHNLLRENFPELEVTLYVLTRPAGDNPGKLIQIAWNQAVEHFCGQQFELNFGAGVVGRAASLQKSIAWAPCGSEVPFDRALADFYVSSPRGHAHTGIVAIPIPDTQPYAILSIASRRDDLFSNELQKILGSDDGKGTQASGEFRDKLTRIHDLAKRIEDELNNVESGSSGGERDTSKGDQTQLCPASHNDGKNEIVAAGVTQTENRRWNDAICPVNPDEIQRILEQFEIGPSAEVGENAV